MHCAKARSREGDEEPGVVLDARRETFSSDDASGDQDPGIGLVEIGTCRADSHASVLAGNPKARVLELSGGHVHDAAGEPNGV